MNTKDFLRLGVPLGQATRRATDLFPDSSSAAARPGARNLFRFIVRSCETLEKSRGRRQL